MDNLIYFTESDDNECKGYLNSDEYCQFSINDLPKFLNLNNIVAYAFFIKYDPIAYQCMEEWYRDREDSKQAVNMDFYCNRIKKHSTLANCH